MISIRTLFLFSCVALLSGCASSITTTSTPCPGPGQPSAGNHSCWYWLMITNIDPDKNLVSGTDKKGGNFTFRVREVEMLTRTNQLQKGEAYVFSGVSNSPYLELYVQGALDPKLKKMAEEVMD